MNILKERIKLFLTDPGWRFTIKQLKKSRRKKIILFGTPVHGNLGDHAIAFEEKCFFEDFFPEYQYFEILMPLYHTQKEKIKPAVNLEDMIVISGGGWMGNLWLHNEEVIREIIRSYPDNEIVILPQTIYYTSDESGDRERRITREVIKAHKNLQIFAREKISYCFFKENFCFSGNSGVYLAPDMVLYGKNIGTDWNEKKEKNVIQLCMREDCEAAHGKSSDFYLKLKSKYSVRTVNTVIKGLVAPQNRVRELKKSFATFQNAHATITDRLHAMLFSVLNGTPCIVLNNKTGKVFGVAEWLEETGMITRVKSAEEALEQLGKADTWERKQYNREALLMHFKDMSEVIEKSSKCK